ncbi:Wzz/FepE/Etk N-terminal domain-containing protein [Paraburkholderia fungorum]|uniref:GumC family protein n=1 Tax=Paraburkholderia fungorum TaxID=134537 RepID=UPI0038BAC5F5
MSTEFQGGAHKGADMATDVVPNPALLSALQVLQLLGRGKKVVFLTTAILSGLALAVALIKTPTYTASTLILPPQQSIGATASSLAGLGALTGLAGSGLGVKSSDEMYASLMVSESVLDGLINHFDLKTRYRADTMQDARTQLMKRLSVVADKKSGLLTLKIEDRDPMFAANLANEVVPEFRRLLDRVAVTEAQQRRRFLEDRIARTRTQIADAEMRLRSAQASSGLLSIDAQTQAAIRQAAELRAEIVAVQVKMDSMAAFATAENPEMKRSAAELSGLRQRLSELEAGTDAARPDAASDAKGLDNVRAYRDLRYQEAMLDTLTKQVELARIDEAKEGPLVQVIDVARPPERRSGPKRLLIVVGGLLAGLIVGGVMAVVSQSKLAGPYAESLARVREAWSVSRSASSNRERL